MVLGHELRAFERLSACRQAEHSPLFHTAPQHRHIRHPGLLQLLRRHRRSAVGFTDHDHRPVFTNQIGRVRRQFVERHIRCLSDMSKRAGELVRTPHVDDKQRGLPPKTPRKRLWRNPRRRFWQSPKPAGQKVHGAIFRGSLSVRKLRARGSRASNQRASSSGQVIRDGFQIVIRSTSSSVISSPVRSCAGFRARPWPARFRACRPPRDRR
jgi:hypothetical protein